METRPTYHGLEPFYFGTTERPLFGAYHAPAVGRRRTCGVLMCYPMAQEYLRAHRAYRQLAVQLAQNGFPVLRFDFYGCGDSGGDADEGDMMQWRRDIVTALGALHSRATVAQICVIGLRLGGTLALLVGAERGGLDGLVVWDPILDGRAYLEELITLHEDVLRGSGVPSRLRHSGAKPQELLGFPVTATHLADLERLTLTTFRQRPAARMLLLDTQKSPGLETLQQHLQQLGMTVTYCQLPAPPLWHQDPLQALVPQDILHAVVDWTCEVYA